MSLKSKASKLDFSILGSSVAAPAPSPVSTGEKPVAPSAPGPVPSRPKTAPGAMMAFANDARSDLLRENEQLKAKAAELETVEGRLAEMAGELEQWANAKATRLLDPKRIRRSKFANRDSRYLASPEFETLKSEIRDAGGNVQPIKVRPLSAPVDGFDFEIVFGHRRHEACLQLGLPVLALVENLDDASLFQEMDRENRARKDLSAWEQGVMYRRALDAGLYSSNRKLAEAVGADLSAVGKALSLASLPDEVVAAFASPLEIQFRFAKPLLDALGSDREVLIRRARSVQRMAPRPGAKQVFALLVRGEEEGGGTVPPPSDQDKLMAGGKVVGAVTRARSGRVDLQILEGLLDEKGQQELVETVETFMARRVARRK